MISKVLFFIVLVLGAASGSPRRNNNALNEMIDLVLSTIDQKILDSGLDPAVLPDVGYKFEKKIMLVTWHGEAMAYNGTLSGMASLHRTGDAEAVLDEKNRTIGVTVTFSMNDLEGFYKYKAAFMELGPRGDIDVSVQGIKLTLSMAVDSQRCVFSLQRLNIDNIGHISIKIHGLGLLNWIANAFASVIANVVEVFLRNIIETTMTSIINSVLESFDLYPYRWFVPFIHCDKRINAIPQYLIQ